MQYFRLTLACGHHYHESAVEIHNGAPYTPDYVGRVMPGRCCNGPHIVTAQHRVKTHTAPLAHELERQQAQLDRIEREFQATKAALEEREKELPAAVDPAGANEIRERVSRLAALRTKLTRLLSKCRQPH
jgi:hypothetical protein